MSTLVLPRAASMHWSWRRVGALSGAFSLHLLVAALLLVPPAAVQLLRATREEPVVVVLKDPVRETPPPPLVPRVKLKPQPAPKPVPIAEPPRVTVVDSTPPGPAVPSPPGPPAPDTRVALVADTPPVALAYLTRTPVRYPKDALQRHEQGTVILRVLVGADGVPQDVEIEKTSGSRSLDVAARNAVAHWTFTPGTVNGVRSALWARVPIAFDLQVL